jgi:L-histidine Nalpha-methyltransferase
VTTTSRPRVAVDPAFAADVAYYLSLEPRQLPSRYLYDALGSSLFEAICLLPWYGLTRAENRLLTAHAADVWRRARGVEVIAELGPGSGEKLALLLAAAPERPTPIDVHLIDVSSRALTQAAHTLATAHATLLTHQSDYETGLLRFAEARPRARPALIVFLGSNLGNFDEPARDALLDAIRTASRPGDRLLIGVDLVKATPDLVRAYDDPLGVTAAFNRNLLVRINRELGGNFVLDDFAHRALWNAAASRIELHLWSARPRPIRVLESQLAFTIRAGESIWTASSYKFTPESLAALLVQSGFAVLDQWIDVDDPFALTLAAVNE